MTQGQLPPIRGIHWRPESYLEFVNSSNQPSASCFVFIDSLGESYQLNLDKKAEGVFCLFPATYKHMVYPFYTSDDARISISGNFGAASLQ